MARYYIGIDPGEHTGLAIWDTKNKCFAGIYTTTAASAILHVWDGYVGWNRDTVIVMEDARKRKWIPQEKTLREFRGRAMGAGSVKRDCTIWEEWCKYHHIECVKTPPRAGMTKLSDAFFQGLTGYDRRTNNHGRDAAMLIFGR